jgi:hypothetical protein
MATISSNLTRSLFPSQDSRNQPDALVTTVTQRRAPHRQFAPRVLFALPNEPEDARLTGGTRSLDRRLLALNLSVPHSGSNAA